MCFLFVKIFCCYVYVVSKETRKRVVFNDKEWKFKEQRAKMWGKILRGEKIISPRDSSDVAGASAVARRLQSLAGSVQVYTQLYRTTRSV